MDFTTTGEKLASVGQAPDFMLTVWDWVNEKVILHCKAFGQDVAKVIQPSGIWQYLLVRWLYSANAQWTL